MIRVVTALCVFPFITGLGENTIACIAFSVVVRIVDTKMVPKEGSCAEKSYSLSDLRSRWTFLTVQSGRALDD